MSPQPRPDADLLRGLRGMWHAYDPAPAGLADRILFALELEDLDFELMRLVQSAAPAGVRGRDTMRTVTFTGERITVIIVLPDGERAPRRIDGWLSPRAALRVQLCVGSRSLTTVADNDGRFAFDDVPSGLGRLLVHPTPGAAVELATPQATPSILL